MSKEKKILSTKEVGGVTYNCLGIDVEYGIGTFVVVDGKKKENIGKAVGVVDVLSHDTMEKLFTLENNSFVVSEKNKVYNNYLRQTITDAENTLRRVEREKALQPQKAILKQTAALAGDALKAGLDINAIIAAAIAQAVAAASVQAAASEAQEKIAEKKTKK